VIAGGTAVLADVSRVSDSGRPGRVPIDAPVQAGYASDSHRWQVAAHGQRFLVLANDGREQGAPLDAIGNWRALLNKQGTRAYNRPR